MQKEDGAMRRNRLSLYTILALLAGLALVLSGGAIAPTTDVAFAKEDADPDAYRSYDVGGGLVTLDVEDAPFGQIVAERIQPRTRVHIEVVEAAKDLTVTGKFVDVHWVLVLDTLTEKVGGFLVRKAPNFLKVTKPKSVKMSFTNADIIDVIQGIAQYGEANVIVSPKVEGTITVNFTGTPWQTALEVVVRTVGNFALVEEDFGIFTVIPREELELDTEVYRFRYLRPPPVYKGVMATSSSGGSGGGADSGTGGSSEAGLIYLGDPQTPSDDPTTIEEQFPIIAALKQIVDLDEGGDVKYIASDNAIIARGTKPRLQKLKALVARLDVEPPQVFIDMNFITTTNNDAMQLGMDGGNNGLAGGFSGADIIHQMPFNVGGGSGLADAITGTAFPPPSSSAFSYGTLTTSETSMLWSFLQRDQSTRIVQAPKLLALDNQAATIFIGDTIRYARTTAATNQNGGLQFAVEEDPNSPVNVGFQLLVIPHVVPGENKIRMTVIPQRRFLTGTGPMPGFDRITVSGQTIDLPRVRSSTLVTHMILRDNQTAVIGGLLEDREVTSVDKVPFLGDIPLAGLIFQGTKTSTVKDHLLITITPRILTGTDAVNCTISDELSGRACEVSAEYEDLYKTNTQWPGQDNCTVQPKAAADNCPPPPPPPSVANGAAVPVAPSR